MSLYAFVNCNCYQSGKTTPFPLPDLEQHFGTDDEGFFRLLLDESYENEKNIVEEWMIDACEHEDMEYVSVLIANWGGYSYFKQALEGIGWVYFPTLYAELPQENSGSVTSDKATQILKELNLFRDMASNLTMPFLGNTKNDEVVQKYGAENEGVFLWAGKEKLALGIDPDGFFVANIHLNEGETLQAPVADKNQTLFRSMRFEQRLMDFNEHGVPQKVEYYDADTENRFVCETPVMIITSDSAGNLQKEFPPVLHVETRPIDATEFAHQLNALETVCKASIETGNPIVWC